MKRSRVGYLSKATERNKKKWIGETATVINEQGHIFEGVQFQSLDQFLALFFFRSKIWLIANYYENKLWSTSKSSLSSRLDFWCIFSALRVIWKNYSSCIFTSLMLARSQKSFPALSNNHGLWTLERTVRKKWSRKDDIDFILWRLYVSASSVAFTSGKGYKTFFGRLRNTKTMNNPHTVK